MILHMLVQNKGLDVPLGTDNKGDVLAHLKKWCYTGPRRKIILFLFRIVKTGGNGHFEDSQLPAGFNSRTGSDSPAAVPVGWRTWMQNLQGFPHILRRWALPSMFWMELLPAEGNHDVTQLNLVLTSKWLSLLVACPRTSTLQQPENSGHQTGLCLSSGHLFFYRPALHL